MSLRYLVVMIEVVVHLVILIVAYDTDAIVYGSFGR